MSVWVGRVSVTSHLASRLRRRSNGLRELRGLFRVFVVDHRRSATTAQRMQRGERETRPFWKKLAALVIR